jgi:hypothetical protein
MLEGRGAVCCVPLEAVVRQDRLISFPTPYDFHSAPTDWGATFLPCLFYDKVDRCGFDDLASKLLVFSIKPIAPNRITFGVDGSLDRYSLKRSELCTDRDNRAAGSVSCSFLHNSRWNAWYCAVRSKPLYSVLNGTKEVKGLRIVSILWNDECLIGSIDQLVVDIHVLSL